MLELFTSVDTTNLYMLDMLDLFTLSDTTQNWFEMKIFKIGDIIETNFIPRITLII